MADHGGLVQIPLYATIGRGDRFALALAELAPISARYGATYYEVRRSGTDRYKFTLVFRFEDSRDFYAFWEGTEGIDFRVRYGTWFQKPVVYDWLEEVIVGTAGENGNGSNGDADPEPEPAGSAGDVA